MWISIVAGLILLTLGAEGLVRGASGLARRLGLSELLIGLTLVGFGTSTPELVSSVHAALIGAPGVAVGNVVGSNIANILLILGIAAIIRPVTNDGKAFRRDGSALAVITAIAIAVAFTGVYARAAGAGFLVLLAGYLYVAYRQERRAETPAAKAEAVRHEHEAAAIAPPKSSAPADAVFVLAGLALLIIGARLLVSGAVDLAQAMNVSDTIIGLTIVAIGTSLPELVTSALASMRGKSDIALGNVVGSNIYNLLGILGATALIHPVAVDPQILHFDVWVMAGATLALIVFSLSGAKISRFEGACFLAAYGAYIAWLIRLA